MDVALGMWVQFVLYATYNTYTEIRNVFNYLCTDFKSDEGDNTLETAAESFWAKMFTQAVGIHTITSEVMSYYRVLAQIIDRDTREVVYSAPYDPTPVAGTQGTDALPPYVAFKFRFNRPNTLVRYGWKRLCGVPEGANVDGLVDGAWRITNQPNLVAGFMGESVGWYGEAPSAPGYTTLSPVIVRATWNGDEVRPVELVEPLGVSFITTLGTQNTRKFGAGI